MCNASLVLSAACTIQPNVNLKSVRQGSIWYSQSILPAILNHETRHQLLRWTGQINAFLFVTEQSYASILFPQTKTIHLPPGRSIVRVHRCDSKQSVTALFISNLTSCYQANCIVDVIITHMDFIEVYNLFYGAPWAYPQTPSALTPDTLNPVILKAEQMDHHFSEGLDTHVISNGTISCTIKTLSEPPQPVPMFQSLASLVSKDFLKSHRQERIKKTKDERNAITNIGNQLLTFLTMSRRNRNLIERMCPELTWDQLEGYYAFAKNVKDSFRGYVTFAKLSGIWHSPPATQDQEIFTRIIRKLSYYYLRQILPSALITSKQIHRKLTHLHLQFRSKMLHLLRGEQPT